MLMALILWPALALMVVFIADHPWRSTTARRVGAVLRVAMTLLFAVLLYWEVGAGVGRAWRRALVTSDRVTSMPPALPTLTDYQSGVTTMERETGRETPAMLPFLMARAVLVGPSVSRRLQRPWHDAGHIAGDGV